MSGNQTDPINCEFKLINFENKTKMELMFYTSLNMEEVDNQFTLEFNKCLENDKINIENCFQNDSD